MVVWIVIVEWLARLIMLILVALSVWSIAIILDRKKFFKNLDRDAEFEKMKKEAVKFKPETSALGLSHFLYNRQLKMQKGLGVLGTLGSTTPFIGLLGTILGIIVAFGELSNGSAGTNAIMFALAEALILTAIGLFVAIPAVIAFNFFNKKGRDFKNEQQSRLNEFIAKGIE